jgi:hypothetical protein
MINELGCGVENSSDREKERASSCIVVIIEFEMAGSYIEEQLMLGAHLTHPGLSILSIASLFD